jgi:hypothetical protein
MLVVNDWLGTNPLFISKNRGTSGSLISDLVQESEPISEEGLSLYLLFGYSALQKTIFQDIDFTKPGEIVELDAHGRVVQRKIEKRPFESIEPNLSSVTAIEKIQSWVHAWETSFEGDIIIPLSGGFDSRLLLSFIKDKSRVHTYTYGLTSNPNTSHEVRIAKRIAFTNNVKWKLIRLDGYHRHLNTWDSLFGPSTHAHGMYQIEFYNQISKLHDKNAKILSGIIGDAWAGSKQFEAIKCPEDVLKLALTHGLSDISLDRRFIENQNDFIGNLPSLTRYFEINRDVLRDERMRVVESMRIKMMLLRYLIKVPNHFNLAAESPFLDSEIAHTMLSIKKEEWEERRWQKRFFERSGLDPKWLIPPSTQNIVSLKAIMNKDVPSLTNKKSNFVDLPNEDHNSFYRKHRVSIGIWYRMSRSNLVSAVWIKLRRSFGKKPTNAEKTLELYTKFLLVYPIQKHI